MASWCLVSFPGLAMSFSHICRPKACPDKSEVGYIYAQLQKKKKKKIICFCPLGLGSPRSWTERETTYSYLFVCLEACIGNLPCAAAALMDGCVRGCFRSSFSGSPSLDWTGVGAGVYWARLYSYGPLGCSFIFFCIFRLTKHRNCK